MDVPALAYAIVFGTGLAVLVGGPRAARALRALRRRRRARALVGVPEPDALVGRHVIAGVEVDWEVEVDVLGQRTPSHHYTIRLAQSVPAALRVAHAGLGRPDDALVLGDATFDGVFTLRGPRALAVLHFDGPARRALYAAVNKGWRLEDDRLTLVAGPPRSDERALEAGARAVSALRVAPGLERARLASIAAVDRCPRMRRRALALLVIGHHDTPEERAARVANADDEDPIVAHLAALPTTPADVWLAATRELARTADGAVELAEALADRGDGDALPLIGELLLARPDPEARAALTAARDHLRGLGHAGPGRLALVRDAPSGALSLPARDDERGS